MTDITLKRSISLPLIVLYGLGTTIGGGIYALVGELAGAAGFLAPASFLIASLLAFLTALSFAELCGRYPRAAGEAVYVMQGFSSKNLSFITGMLVIFAGIVSSAALANAFVGYFNEFIVLDRILVIIGITLILGSIAAWGIAESLIIAGLVTLVEIGGLIMIVFLGHDSLMLLPENFTKLVPPLDFTGWGGMLGGTILAFYAFIGFEDMVNVAEEVKNVKRNLPLAIIITIAVTTVLYLLIMIVAILSLPVDDLAGSQAPLALLFEHYTGRDAVTISIIGMFAIINGSLIQIIMSSRVIYGLSSSGQLPGFLSKVNRVTRTPVIATSLVTSLVMLLALIGELTTLAEVTSLILLVVFSFINLALWKIKKREPVPVDSIVFPAVIPMLGFITSSGFVLYKLWSLAGI